MPFIRPNADATLLHIAHYNDLGEAARHYSLVRMTLGTFWLGLPLVVLQVSADSANWLGFLVIAGMCAFGLSIYCIFTSRAFAKRRQQVAMLNVALAVMQIQPVTEKPNPWGPEGYWLGIIAYGLVFTVDVASLLR